MLKYTTAPPAEDGTFSPGPSNREIEQFMREISVSAASNPNSKMAVKKRGKRNYHGRDSQQHLPPIAQPGSPPGILVNQIPSEGHDRREISYTNHMANNRKEIRTPYISHIGINRLTDVATPYVMHSQITKIEPASSPLLIREGSKLSKLSQGNIVEVVKHERTFSSLHKGQMSQSMPLERRPRAADRRHGRKYDEVEFEKEINLQVQSNQIGLNQRSDKKPRDRSKGRGNEFSIRKKIEQFRKWHEEQYKDKIKKLKQEVDNQYKEEQIKLNRPMGDIREDSLANDNSIVGPSENSHEKMDVEKEVYGPADSTTTITRDRTTGSARTWHTWRDANDSYAYNDVKKYIKDNELMDSEKEMWIKKWIIEVNKALEVEMTGVFL